ncbi:MAG: sulfatase [Lentisphaerae bacterium]|jgi:arylsulfatase A-like enzyme|nr:sulfatase [Lentisphaerota bacterium]MBT4818254.1 sulfatase [Lentisphaerota bacterium]MBT5612664.1 sulfatase [Lentisphaerota bacterium]MBT7053688.1 sulfatase [Lentisphaerota bacterium]MBT7841149.1 sulfatase [Lentisphaerota bacterium]
MNVLLITVDTLRADRLSCYGYKRLTTPHIDRLAGEGTLFLDMVAPHIPTHPAFTSLMTGHDVFSHQIVAHGGAVELAPHIRTLAEILSARGYHTAAADNLGKWFARGFEAYDCSSFESDFGMWGWTGENVNKVACHRLNGAVEKDSPFFIWVHYWDPHTPYNPPAPFRRMFYEGDERDPNNRSMARIEAENPFKSWVESDAWQLRGIKGATDVEFVKAQYDSEVAYTDVCVAHLLTRLRELGLEEDTLVVFMGDHGEVLDDQVCYFDHHGLYDANVCVPLIFRCPGTVPAGKRIHGQVATYDVTPTILDLLGYGDETEKNDMTGLSCRPLMASGNDNGNHDAVVLTECTWMRKRGLRTRDWKYIEALEPDFHGLPPVELYDVREGPPREQTNLANERPDVAAQLHKQMHAMIRERLAATGNTDPLEEQEITLGKRIVAPNS